MRILIVDDGQSGLDFAHHLKTMYGAETFIAKSIKDGLVKRRQIKNLDFVVLDLSYPESTREQSIACIPELAADGMQVFVFTGYEEKELLQKSLEAGATDWFLKGDNHRGGSALGGRLASLYYRQRRPVGREGDQLASSLLQTRKEQAENPPDKRSWFTTAPAFVTMAILLIVNLGLLVGFIYSQGASNALFRQQVTGNTGDIAILKTKADTFHDQNQTSILDRQQINKRLDEKDKDYNALRAEITNGFNHIYEILLDEKQRK